MSVKIYTKITASTNITHAEHRLLAIIGVYSSRFEVCEASTRTIAKDNPCMTEHSISRTITSLKRKGYLFTYQIFEKKMAGSSRYMVREEEWPFYYDNLSKRKQTKIAEELKDYFENEKK